MADDVTTTETPKKRKPGRARGTGSIFKPRGSQFYWIAYVRDGKRYFEGTKSTSKKDAQDLLTIKLGDIAHGVAVTPKIGKLKLGDGLDAVVNDLRINGRRSARCYKCKTICTIEGHASDIARRIQNHLLKYFTRDRRMSSITTADIEKYKGHRLDEKAKPATVNRELATLRRAYRLAMRGGELASMPYVGLLEEKNVRQGFLEREQFEAILKHLPADLRPPVEFAYATGWRFASEILSLQTSQVDLAAGVVRLEPGTTKSGKGRQVYFTDDLRTILERQFRSIAALKKRNVICTYVFHRTDGARIQNMRSAWEAAREAAGFPNALLHDFRRTAVRNLERANVARSTAMAMVGHETEAIYRRYAIQDEAMLREGAAKLDAWRKGTPPEAKPKGQLAKFRRRKVG